MSKRQRWDMPKDVWDAILAAGLKDAYDERPPYQKNDYIGWIEQAKRPETRQKRIDQMISELEAGDRYMNMDWGKSADKKKAKDKPQTIQQYVASSGELFKEVILELDKCLLSIHKDYVTKHAWGGWNYKLGKNYSCIIVRYKDHVKLMIWRGKMLDDKAGILQGSGSNTQHVRLKSVDDINCAALTDLLRQQKKLYDSGIRYEG